MTDSIAPRRRTASRAAQAVAVLGAAASIAIAAPGTAGAAIAVPEVPEWVTAILPSPEQVTDWSGQYDQLIAGLGGEDAQGALKGWNSIAGALPKGLLPVITSESTAEKGNPKKPSDGSGIHFKSFLERDDMKGFADLVGASNIGMLNLAEIFAPADKIVLTRTENITSFASLLLSGTTKLTNSYGHMPSFKVLGNDVPEFIIWIPEAQGDYTSIGGSGFGFHNSLPTMALPGLGAIPLPHLAGYLTAPLGLGGADYYLKTQLPALGADGSMGLLFPAFGGSLNSPFGTIDLGFDKGPSVSILDGGLGFGLGSPTFTWVDPLGAKHDVGFTLGGISYTQEDGLQVTRPDITVDTTPAPEPASKTLDAPLVAPQAERSVSKSDGAARVVADETAAPEAPRTAEASAPSEASQPSAADSSVSVAEEVTTETESAAETESSKTESDSASQSGGAEAGGTVDAAGPESTSDASDSTDSTSAGDDAGTGAAA